MLFDKLFAFKLQGLYTDNENILVIIQVKELRKLISKTTSELSAKVPASSFSHSSKLLWEQIRRNKRLDLPSHKVLHSAFEVSVLVRFYSVYMQLLNSLIAYGQVIIATVFCNKIVEEALNSLYSDKVFHIYNTPLVPIEMQFYVRNNSYFLKLDQVYIKQYQYFMSPNRFAMKILISYHRCQYFLYFWSHLKYLKMRIIFFLEQREYIAVRTVFKINNGSFLLNVD